MNQSFGLVPNRIVKVNTGFDPCWVELSKYIRFKAPIGQWNINTPLMIRKYTLTWAPKTMMLHVIQYL